MSEEDKRIENDLRLIVGTVVYGIAQTYNVHRDHVFFLLENLIIKSEEAYHLLEPLVHTSTPKARNQE